MQGGSTITQQFVKNSCVTSQRTISRKLKEAALAWQLEQRWSKDRILTAYLNTIYFGNGAYGIQRAAQTYFNTTASRLDTAAGRAPGRHSRRSDPLRPGHESADRAGTPARGARRDARAERDLEADVQRRRPVRRCRARRTCRFPGIQGPAPYFVNYVKQQLIEQYGTRRVFGGGLNVQTTIDLRLQKLAPTRDRDAC